MLVLHVNLSNNLGLQQHHWFSVSQGQYTMVFRRRHKDGRDIILVVKMVRLVLRADLL